LLTGPLILEMRNLKKELSDSEVFLADRKTTYTRNFNARVDNLPISSGTIGEYVGTHSTRELDNLAVPCGVYSRFNVDPGISKSQCERLYKLWLQYSLTKERADAVFTAQDNGKISGLIMVYKKPQSGEICLVSVEKHMQGKDIGMALVKTAEKWFILRGCQEGRVVT